MVPDQQRLSPEDRSNLVAYLDNELNEPEARAMATKLTQSMTARREVDALQKTWDMLDLLYRPKASDDFTARTLTFADQVDTKGDRVASAASDLARKVGFALAWVGFSAFLFVVGYTLTLRVWPNRSARLARDLPIAESLDEYRDVGSLEFLKAIDTATEFD